MYIQNPYPKGGKEQSYEFSGTAEKEISVSAKEDWTNGFGLSFEYSVEASVKAPLLAGGKVTKKGGAKYDFAHLKSSGDETKKKKTLTWRVGSSRGQLLKPQEAVRCSASSFTGMFQSRWTGTVRARFRDDSSFEYRVRGDYQSVGWTETVASCEPWDIKDIPEGAAIATGSDIDMRAMAFRA